MNFLVEQEVQTLTEEQFAVLKRPLSCWYVKQGNELQEVKDNKN